MQVTIKRVALVADPNPFFIHLLQQALVKEGIGTANLYRRYGNYTFSGLVIEVDNDMKLNGLISKVEILNGTTNQLIIVNEYREGEQYLGKSDDGTLLTKDLGKLTDITIKENPDDYFQVNETKYAFERGYFS